VAALRVSESLFKKGDKTFAADVQAASKDKDANVVIQSMLTARQLDLPDWKTSIAALVVPGAPLGVREIGNAILNPPGTQTARRGDDPRAGETLQGPARRPFKRSAPPATARMPRVCRWPVPRPARCSRPRSAGSKTLNGWRDGSIKVLLHGLNGDNRRKKYEGQMIAMATNDDAWIAGVLSYVRNSFGNKAGFISRGRCGGTPCGEQRAHAAVGRSRSCGASLPKPLANRKDWKLTASHGAGACAAAVDGNADSRYTTNAPQVPGMWFQIELPQETAISGLELDSAKSPSDYPRGYEVALSTDGKTWGKPRRLPEKGGSAVTAIAFAPAKAKFIKITQTGSVGGLFWSIHELQIFAASGCRQRRGRQRPAIGFAGSRLTSHAASRS